MQDTCAQGFLGSGNRLEGCGFVSEMARAQKGKNDGFFEINQCWHWHNELSNESILNCFD
jgi:hypothetical protein